MRHKLNKFFHVVFSPCTGHPDNWCDNCFSRLLKQK